MVRIVEHERGGLIDRRHPRARGGIGLRACMNRKGRKSGKTIAHSSSFVMTHSQAGGRMAASPRSATTGVGERQIGSLLAGDNRVSGVTRQGGAMPLLRKPSQSDHASTDDFVSHSFQAE